MSRIVAISLKGRIRAAQVQAAFAVNRELILLYWSIGRDLSQRFAAEEWGGKIIDRLALCIAHSILPKEEWLAKVGSHAEWPVWGKMGVLHGDNAFRLKLLSVACHDHGIDQIWRPVKNPLFGGQIERWCGTLGAKIHFLPGTTYSNSKERGEYDSDAKAAFTLAELRQWLTERIAAYHAEPHSQLGMPL